VLFYLKPNEGHSRALYPPARDRAMVECIVERAGLRGTVADAPAETPRPTQSDMHVDDRADHNDRIITARCVGDDLLAAVTAARDDALARRADCVYVDLPLADPGTQMLGDGLRDLGFVFGGVFPNRLHDCDVLRYQYLDDVTVDARDIELASDHCRELLDYVMSSV
jgi:hypothetical protein